MTLREMRERLPGWTALWDRISESDGCWEWTGYVADTGYGRLIVSSQPTKYLLAHRAVYRAVNGEIPHGHHVHHICKNKKCVNPQHLLAVSPREHTRLDDSPCGIRARVTRCCKGHEYTEQNTGRNQNGTRYCRQCNRDRANSWYARIGRTRRLERMGRI